MSSFRLQGLEDQFDRKSRRRLDGFIVPEGAGTMFKETEKRDENEVVQQSALDANTTFYYVTPLSGTAGEVEEHRVLTRLPIFVIFHGMTHERGVPPSFIGLPTSHCSAHPPSNQKHPRFHPAVARATSFWRLPHGVCPTRCARRTCGPLCRYSRRLSARFLRRRTIYWLP